MKQAKKLILASSSPRRIELLSMLRWDFEVRPSVQEEIMTPGMPPDQIVVANARTKAFSVFRESGRVALGADTVVSIGGETLGKPKDAAEAAAMLFRLQGATHSVYTGICAIGERILTDYVKTEVTFLPMSGDEIYDYIATGEPMDKAGAYGVQGLGSVYIERICGCYYNVMGLPLSTVRRMLNELSFFER